MQVDLINWDDGKMAKSKSVLASPGVAMPAAFHGIADSAAFHGVVDCDAGLRCLPRGQAGSRCCVLQGSPIWFWPHFPVMSAPLRWSMLPVEGRFCMIGAALPSPWAVLAHSLSAT